MSNKNQDFNPKDDNLSYDNNLFNLITNIRLWFRSMLIKWWIFFIVGLIGGISGFLIAYYDRPKYESHLTFALDAGGGEMGSAMSLAAEFGFNMDGSKNVFEGDNILTLLTSRRIVERVLLSIDTVDGKPMTMAAYYTNVSADTTKKNSPKKLSELELRLSSVSFPAGQPRTNFSYLQDSVLKNIYKDFTVGGKLKVSRPDKKLNLYEVSVTSYNERFSKVFTDRLINEATSFYIEIRTQKSKETLEVLESRVSQTKGSLNNAISSRANAQDANVNPAFQRTQAQLQMKQVDITTYGGAYGEMYKNLELARYQYLKDKPFLQIIDASDYPLDKIKKGKIKTAVIFSLISVFILLAFLTISHIVTTELRKGRPLIVKQ